MCYDIIALLTAHYQLAKILHQMARLPVLLQVDRNITPIQGKITSALRLASQIKMTLL